MKYILLLCGLVLCMSSINPPGRKVLIVGNWIMPPFKDITFGMMIDPGEKMTFFKDGTFTRTHTAQNYEGTYKFIHDEQQLEMRFDQKSIKKNMLTEEESTMLSDIVKLSPNTLTIKIHYGERISEPYTYTKAKK